MNTRERSIMNYNEASQVQEEFCAEYIAHPRFLEYTALVTSYKISKLRELKYPVPDEIPDDDWCLRVGLNEELPEDLSFPKIYKNVHILTYLSKIELQEK